MTADESIQKCEQGCEDTKEDLVAFLKELKGEREKSRWIRTKDALPENKTYVLTTIHVPGRQPHVRSGWYQNGLFMNDNGDCWKSTDREVVAWMYQPEPYTKGKK